MTDSIGRRRRTWASVAAGTWLVLFAAGCASVEPPMEGPLPRHPFPRWVSHLESGSTDVEEVRLVFGEPAEIEEHRRGVILWRYAFEEVHWSANDPDRPEIAADGTRTPRTRTRWTRARDDVMAFGRFLDRLLYYPASRPTRPSARTMPATVHALELSFRDDGTLERYRYAPRSELVVVRPDRS